MKVSTIDPPPKLLPSYRPVIERLSREFPEFTHPEVIHSVHGALALMEGSSSRLSLFDAASLLLGARLKGETH